MPRQPKTTDLTAARDAAVNAEIRARSLAMMQQPSFLSSLEAVNSQMFDGGHRTRDSFQNFALDLGIGTDNALSGSTYGFNPITRNRTLLEWMHRGSWLAGIAVDAVGDDMTRAGVEITSDMDPEAKDQLNEISVRREIWPSINDTVRWSRLYGGALAVILIDGAKMDTPLDVKRIGPNQFKGLMVLDRWMVEPNLRVVNEIGPHLGLPVSYQISTNAPGLHGMRVHYSRCLRLDGVRLPYTQRLMENLWGISILERLYDRMVAFDSATQGAAQLVYKSYIRTYKVKDLRKIVAGDPEIFAQLIAYVEFMRRFQGIEGMTMLDAEDDFQGQQQTSFTGISDALMQFGQQIAGALQIPLVRLFGMSPAGFSATGESDLRTYYDGIKQRQERDLRIFIDKLYRIMAKSAKVDLGDDFQFQFQPLWQLTEDQKATVASTVTASVSQAFTEGLVTKGMALRELKQSGRDTGIWSSITAEEIEEAENEPPPGMGMPGMEGAMPGMPGAEGPPGMEGMPPGAEGMMPPPGPGGEGGGEPNGPPAEGPPGPPPPNTGQPPQDERPRRRLRVVGDSNKWTQRVMGWRRPVWT